RLLGGDGRLVGAGRCDGLGAAALVLRQDGGEGPRGDARAHGGWFDAPFGEGGADQRALERIARAATAQLVDTQLRAQRREALFGGGRGGFGLGPALAGFGYSLVELTDLAAHVPGLRAQ